MTTAAAPASTRFSRPGNFLSYCRLMRCAHESAGEVKGFGPRRIGSGHLRWAPGEAACLLLRCHEPAGKWLARREQKGTKARALGILAAKLERTAYHLWRERVAFDAKKFLTN